MLGPNFHTVAKIVAAHQTEGALFFTPTPFKCIDLQLYLNASLALYAWSATGNCLLG